MSFDGPHRLGPDGPDGSMPEEMLSAYLDDELTADERAAVDERLAASPEWRAVLDETRRTRDAIRALPAVDGDPAFWVRVLAGDAVVDLDAKRRARRTTGWRAAIAGAAAAVVIVVVGVAAVPEEEKVKPAVATFTDAHAARSSFGDDPMSNLASVGLPGFDR